MRKWNKYSDTKIPIGVKLNVSDPTIDLLLGTRGKVGTKDDGQSGKDCSPETSIGKELVDGDVKDGVDELSKDYKECNELAIADKLKPDWYTIRDKFLGGNGGLVGNLSNIEYCMSNSLTGLKLAQDIDNYFQSEMIKYKGNYSLINFNNANFLPPSFGGVSNSMLALVGGTQQLDVYLSSIKIHEKTYIATVTYILFDSYGVDEEDFLTADSPGGILSGCREGLVAMWILQHCYGYKPLITSFKFTTTIIGSF